MQLADLELHLLAQLLVQSAQRLVHEDQLRLEHQSARHGDALLLAAGELPRIAAFVSRQANQTKHGMNTFLDFGSRTMLQRQTECYVVEHGKVRKQRVILEYHADVALIGRNVRQGLAFEQDFAGGGRLEAGEEH